MRSRFIFSMALAGCVATPNGPSGPSARNPQTELPDLAPEPIGPTGPTPQSTPDLSTVATSPDLEPAATPAGCTTYTPSAVAAMRQGASGCFELDGVVTLAATPVSQSSKSVTLHVQDTAGGDYSAIRIECSSTSTAHPCSAFSDAKSVTGGRKITARGLYLKTSPTKGGFEVFELDAVTDEGAGTAPSPAPLSETDLRRSSATSMGGKPMAAYWFQMVTANLGDKLLMFDWSPPEFHRSGTSTACPQWFGFGLMPTSMKLTAGAACSGNTQPAGQTAANAAEVLIGTDYFDGFTYSTDCACAAGYHDPIPSASQGTTGAITALLDYEVPYGQTTGYQYLAPLTNAAFAIH